MIEQVANSIKFVAFFTSARVGKAGLTVTVDVYNPARTLVVTGGSATAIGGGAYDYVLASGSAASEGEYLAIFKTADTTVDQQHIPALWVVGRAGVENLDVAVGSRSTYAGADTAGTTTLLSRLTSTRASNLDFLDVSVASRLPTASYTAPPTAANIWANATRTLTSGANIALAKGTGVTGFNDITAASVWGVARSGNQAAGTFGEFVDASIASRLASASYTAAPGVAAVADAVWDEARADHSAAGSFGEALDARVSDRATPDQVNAQVLDVLTVDTFAEVSAVPPAETSLLNMLRWVFVRWRNKTVQTGTLATLRSDADNATIGTAPVADSSGTTTLGKWTS